MPEWYIQVGYKIIQTQVVQSLVPYVTLVALFIFLYSKRAWDSKFTMDEYVTRSTGQQQYKSVYAGGEYVIHYKYSLVVNIIYVSMMYGVAMPILFPIAAFSLFNVWVTERIAVSYIVRLPPALDQKLTHNCINLLKWAPLLFLANGYWMISN